MTDRVLEVAEQLMGTCKGLHEVATQEEQDSSTFCAELDRLVMLCAGCEWWHEPCELNSDELCEQCAEDSGFDD